MILRQRRLFTMASQSRAWCICWASVFVVLTSSLIAVEAQLGDYSPEFFDEYTTRCLDDQCDCDKQSSAVICSDSDFTALPKSQLLALPFAVTRFTLTRNRFSINGNLGPENFTGFSNFLEELVLQECGITRLKHGVFNSMPRLIYLDLSMNRIKKLARRQFSMLGNLEVLVLSGNRKLIVDDDSFRGSTASEIALDECGLTSLPKSLSSYPPGLRRLYLQDNRLQTIPPTLRHLFDGFEDVRLRGNRWHCDARLAWLLEIFHRRRDAFSDDPICESPEDMFGRRFSTVSPSESAMKKRVPMPELPNDSSEDFDSFHLDYYLPAVTPPVTFAPKSSEFPLSPISTLKIDFKISSTVVPLSRDTEPGDLYSTEPEPAYDELSAEWEIDYPTEDDEIHAREYEEAYELREHLRKNSVTNNYKMRTPYSNAKPIAVFGSQSGYDEGAQQETKPRNVYIANVRSQQSQLRDGSGRVAPNQVSSSHPSKSPASRAKTSVGLVVLWSLLFRFAVHC